MKDSHYIERIRIFEKKKPTYTNMTGIVCSGMNPGVVQWMALEIMHMYPIEVPLTLLLNVLYIYTSLSLKTRSTPIKSSPSNGLSAGFKTFRLNFHISSTLPKFSRIASVVWSLTL